jgi:hypothetical protein
LRSEGDQPTIGLLLCKSNDRLVAEYALSDIQKPMGLATYTLSHTLPKAPKLDPSCPGPSHCAARYSTMSCAPRALTPTSSTTSSACASASTLA